MGRLRRLSGADVVAILGEQGFVRVRQSGSHVRLRRHVGGHDQG
jgi:predicted RNA binding protein YcfA (HicA-like mRNA interferase family)